MARHGPVSQGGLATLVREEVTADGARRAGGRARRRVGVDLGAAEGTVLAGHVNWKGMTACELCARPRAAVTVVDTTGSPAFTVTRSRRSASDDRTGPSSCSLRGRTRLRW
ncbi:hypothetical protein K7G98_12495 [Saccharothrix sp. MB29]|nr:hypothetical protein [Saccharothrix sp. MB29]